MVHDKDVGLGLGPLLPGAVKSVRSCARSPMAPPDLSCASALEAALKAKVDVEAE